MMDANDSQQIKVTTMQEVAYPATDQEIPLTASDTPLEPIPFLYITPTRLVVMSLLSLNLYTFYWFYQNWKAIKYSKDPDVVPFFQAILAIFFVHSLFEEIVDLAKSAHYKKTVAYKRLATIYIILVIAMKLGLFPVGLVFIPLCLLPFQKAINFLGMQAHCKPRTKLSLGEVLILILWPIVRIIALIYDIKM